MKPSFNVPHIPQGPPVSLPDAFGQHKTQKSEVLQFDPKAKLNLKWPPWTPVMLFGIILAAMLADRVLRFLFKRLSAAPPQTPPPSPPPAATGEAIVVPVEEPARPLPVKVASAPPTPSPLPTPSAPPVPPSYYDAFVPAAPPMLLPPPPPPGKLYEEECPRVAEAV